MASRAPRPNALLAVANRETFKAQSELTATERSPRSVVNRSERRPAAPSINDDLVAVVGTATHQRRIVIKCDDFSVSSRVKAAPSKCQSTSAVIPGSTRSPALAPITAHRLQTARKP